MASKTIHAKRASRIRANNVSGTSGPKKEYNNSTASTKSQEIDRLRQKYAKK